MGDENDRLLLPLPDTEQQFLHQPARLVVESAERLVEQQDFRAVRQGAGDGRSLLHAAGELFRPMVLEAAQADLVDIAIDNLPFFLLGNAAFAQAEGDVFADRQPGKQRIGLEHHAAIRPRPRHRPTGQQHFARRRAVETGDDAQQGRFSASRRAEDGDEIIAGDFQIGGLKGQRRLPALHTRKSAADALDNEFAHQASLQAKSFRFSDLNAKSEIRPIMPMTMMPKMICPVAISAWLLIII